LESLSKIILDHPIVEATRIASKIVMASPSNIEICCLLMFVPAAIKLPSELQKHQLHPVWPEVLKKLEARVLF
jgi:hypothetical protein